MRSIAIRRGSAVVRVFLVPDGPKGPAPGVKRWEVRWRFGGRLFRKKRTSKKAALLLAERQAVYIANGQSAHLRLSDAEAWDAEQALDILRPMGKTLLQLAQDARDHLALVKNAADGLSVAQVVRLFLDAKAKQQLSPYHLRDLDQRLSRFAHDFNLPLSRVTGPMAEAWLDGLKAPGPGAARDPAGRSPAPHRDAHASLKTKTINPRTWNNYRAALAALFEFGRDTGHCPAGAALLKSIRPRKLKKGIPEIYSPAQMRLLLEGCAAGLLPSLVLGAFAGLRSEEVSRLHWRDFTWPEGKIEGRLLLRDSITKTARARSVPLSPNLVAWLKPLAEAKERPEKVCPYKNSKSLSGMKWSLAKRLGLKWGRNALRKSFISYRVALTSDVAKVALECGNSPGQIHAHYLDLVSSREANEWFAIWPAGCAEGLLPLQYVQSA